jgi:mannose-6-phosphate isomerase-like protein (cupin superfamily)
MKNLFTLLFFLFSPVSFALSQSIDSASLSSIDKKYTIENCVNEFSVAKIESTKAGYQYWYADKALADGKTLKLSVVKPHSATHPPHKHAEDEFFFIMEGKAEIYFDGKKKEVGQNTSLYCPSNIEHGIRNIGDTELKYLVIKKYDKK